MRIIIIIIFFAFAIHSRAGMTETYSIISQVQDKEFKSEIALSQLLKTPVWSSQDDFPPLSPRKAEKAATAKFRKLLKDVKGWKCMDISLDHPYEDEHWIYIVTFGPANPNFEEIGSSLQIVVLMDDTVIDPSITHTK